MVRTSAQRRDANTPSDQQQPPMKANPFATFTVGDWSSNIGNAEVWESEEEIDASNEEIYQSSNPVPESTTSSSSEESEDEWDGLEFTEAEEALCQTNGLNPPIRGDSSTDSTTLYQLNGLALNPPTKEEIPPTDTSASEPETSEMSPAQAAFIAQQVLVGLAIDPERRSRPRKDFVKRPSPLRNQVKEQEVQEKRCTSCNYTLFRKVQDPGSVLRLRYRCCRCAIEYLESELDNVKTQQEYIDDEGPQVDAWIRLRKAAVEKRNPQSYREDLKWQKFDTEEAEWEEELVKQTAAVSTFLSISFLIE